MNIYRHTFTALCPNNSLPIKYNLEIEAGNATIQVEEIVKAAKEYARVYQETLADYLHAELGGKQTLKAHHHGVDIETRRG